MTQLKAMPWQTVARYKSYYWLRILVFWLHLFWPHTRAPPSNFLIVFSSIALFDHILCSIECNSMTHYTFIIRTIVETQHRNVSNECVSMHYVTFACDTMMWIFIECNISRRSVMKCMYPRALRINLCIPIKTKMKTKCANI